MWKRDEAVKPPRPSRGSSVQGVPWPKKPAENVVMGSGENP